MKQNQNFNPLSPFFAIAAALLILSACDDNTSSQTDRARETQTSSEQSEVQKYNAYVEVANSVHRPYAEDLATYQRYIQPVLDGKEENDDLLFPSSSTMSRVKDHIKDSIDQASSFLNGEGFGDSKDVFKAALDAFATMASGYDRKVRDQNSTGCLAIMSNANAYLSVGRQIIHRTEDGSYEKDKQQGSQFQLMQSREQQDASSLLQNYNNMISQLNMNQC